MGDKKCINLVSKQGLHVWSKKGRRGRGRRRRGERKSKSKVWKLNLSMEIMDSSIILVQELLEHGLLGFHLDINLVPFSRVLLDKHSNS